jgi:SAM-dependent methyltransferase
MKPDHYDSFAESYSTDNESSLFNAYYARPAMIKLAGDVNGHRILDAGCGSGPLSAALLAKGAIITGFDGSPAMIKLARQRLGENAELHVADLSQPLPFPDCFVVTGTTASQAAVDPVASTTSKRPCCWLGGRQRRGRATSPFSKIAMMVWMV